MASHNQEIEIQVRVEQTEPLLQFLKTEAECNGEKHQRDEYFSPNDGTNDFLKTRPVTQWLRVREANGQASINYKLWHFGNDGKGEYADEYETNADSADQLRAILGALNFRSVVVVEKTRASYRYKEYEIAIDRVTGLGDFVEIEYCGTQKITDPKQCTEDMLEFLKAIGCGTLKRNHRGYPYMLLFPEDVEEETI